MLLALIVGALAATAGWMWLRDDGGADDSASVLGSTSTLPLRLPGDIDDFVSAFEASRTGTYRVVGRLELSEPGVDGSERIDVTIARRGADSVEQWGTSLVVALDGRLQACERLAEGLTCGAVTDAAPTEGDIEALRSLLSGPSPTYELFVDSPGCWQLVATSSPAPAPWGQTTTICFDAGTGAIIRQTTSSATGLRTFVAQEVSATVDDADLSPPTE